METIPTAHKTSSRPRPFSQAPSSIPPPSSPTSTRPLRKPATPPLTPHPPPTALHTCSYSAAVSDNKIVSAGVGAAATAGTYTIEVTDLGSSTRTLSAGGLQTVADPFQQNISSASSFTLTVNGTDYAITPAANTLSELAKAINRTTGANVQASLVNVGPSSSPD